MKPGRRLRLAAKVLNRMVGQAQAQAEHLQGHLAIERRLAGFVHDSHAAAADLADDFKVTQPPATRRAVHQRGHQCVLPRRRSRGLVSNKELPATDPGLATRVAPEECATPRSILSQEAAK